jgi:hypothetical protein
MSSVCNWYLTLPGKPLHRIVLPLPVGCDDPSVAGAVLAGVVVVHLRPTASTGFWLDCD